MSLPLIVAAGCTLVFFILAMGIAALFRAGRDEAEDKVKKRLKQFALTEVESESIDLVLKESSMSEMPWFNNFLSSLQFAANLNKLIAQGKAKGSAGVYLLLCALLGMGGIYIGVSMAERIWVAAILGYFFGSIPVQYLRFLKNRRMDRFQKQLPDALDLMSRALKAGHTFGGGMRMVADEFDDPMGSEMRTTLEEINFGMDVDRALSNLQSRVAVDDLKFFVVSVNIQRETGGNLAEIISNIARLVRERFVLFGKVKVLSAEGRLSALLLSALPFVVVAMMYTINPDYMSLLWTTELGRAMAWGAAISMLIGVSIMRRMVKIKV
ncbi:type II secretion system F family protein [Pseudodesulfovibrio sp. zrk46]|uniref:type II secretion system F family protein n=1 Tax=Pseudodesulfovibrio sp. zrk46 TaxID=2725288 RepID=UPI00144A0254|nr:type II secretion system F family protein [Pseudodesulfovibrio sp. zrk46]QJB55241.1 type II secretion system F family protein [Pseudodesulfovibrio sp. zrk46]